jgi:GMP synthase (glutamine-hydrolysing)
LPITELKFLIAESEPPEARKKRRSSVGRSSGETYEALLEHVAPGASLTRIKPADAVVSTRTSPISRSTTPCS